MAIPSGVIYLWTGTNASIPSGWTRETALDAKYPKGTAASTDPGSTGGALTHSHTTTNHTHTTAHTHTVPTSPNANNQQTRTTGATTLPINAHSHTAPDTVDPTTTVTNSAPSTDAINHEPSFFDVIFIKSNGTPTGIPDGAVALWNTGTAPSGWNLADGASGRPDLRSAFLKGAASAGDGGGTGGAVTHTHTVASHDHGTNYSHGHPGVTSNTTGNTVGADVTGALAVSSTAHAHVLTIGTQATDAITGNTDTAGSQNGEPPYTAIGFIQNNNGVPNLPQGAIGLWIGTLASIPSGWVLCDGGSGTPDLRGQYTKGAATLGGIGATGGSLTHTHTATGHTHAIASHAHTVSAATSTASNNQTKTGGSTTLLVVTNHNTHSPWSNTGASSLTSGSGTPTVANYTDTQPPFYTVAFIQYAGGATTYQDAALLFSLMATGYKDTSLLFRLMVQGYKDAALLFRLMATAYADASTLFRLRVETYKDAALIFRIMVARDAHLLFRIDSAVFKDAHLLFRLKVAAFKDAALLFRVDAASFWDAELLFNLVVGAYKDAALLLRLSIRQFADVALLFNLQGPSYADADTLFGLDCSAFDGDLLFRMVASGYRNAATLFRLMADNYRDAYTIFRLQVAGYFDAALLFGLAVFAFADAAILFNLELPDSVYADAALLFRLEVNTKWGEQAHITLTADMTAGATTATVRSTVTEPTPFLAVIGQELVLVTDVSGMTWTITRGVGGYSAVGGTGGVPTAPIAGVTEAVAHYAGAEFAIRPHTIVVSRGGIIWDYTAIAMNSLRVRYACSGGEMEATWELYTYHPEDWLPDTDAMVMIRNSEGRPYFSGTMGRPATRRLDDGSNHITLVARGFIETADRDPYFVDRQWGPYTAGYQVFEQSRDEKMPHIHFSNQYVFHGGQQIGNTYHGLDKKTLQIWNDIAALGDVTIPLDYFIWTDTDGYPKLELRKRDTAKQVQIPWATVQDIPLAWDASDQLTFVVVRWSGGQVVKGLPGFSETRGRTVDLSNTVDNLATAEALADMILANSGITSIGEAPLVVEYPKVIYDEYGNAIPIWEIRAGWLVQLPGVTAPNTNLPIGLMQIKAVEIDHSTMTARLTLGKYLEYEQWIARLARDDKQRLDSDIHEPISGFPVAPPANLPTGVDTGLAATGAGGRIGYDKVAKDADISTIWYGLDGGGEIITTGRKLDIPIDIKLRVLKLRLRATDGAVPLGEGAIGLVLGHGTGGEPGGEPTIATITQAFGWETLKDLPENQLADEHITIVQPGEYLSVVVADSPTPTAKFATLGITVQRLEGSAKPVESSTPSIQGVNAERDENNVTTFTISVNRACKAQIEFGIDTGYRSLSRPSEVLSMNPVCVVKGLPSTVHYKVHVTDSHGTESVSGDMTL